MTSLLPLDKVAARDDKRRLAEHAIQKILLDLEIETEEIGHVSIDQRNFANLSVEIFFKSEAALDKAAEQP